ncbi:MAG: DUF3465 domain-containing protein [Phycisphaerales bacterium]
MPKNTTKKISPIIIILALIIFGPRLFDGSNNADNQPTATQQHSPKSSSNTSGTGSRSIADSQRDLAALIRDERSGQMVEFSAKVVKVLDDDNDGDRHQRFLLAVESSTSPANTILVAHNIDLAPRVPVSRGDIVQIFGQYEWNDRGGVVHWTHHDPGGRHADGWIQLNSKRYD